MTTDPEDTWAYPRPVSDLDVAFPANALDYMPTREECSEGLSKTSHDEQVKWKKFQNKWFYEGLPPSIQVDLRENVDGNLAFRHLEMIQGSYAPKHEHKQEAVAYLAYRWFKDVRW